MSRQIEMVSLERLVSEGHEYRKFSKIMEFSEIEEELKEIEKEGYKGYGIERLFKCLLLQFMEDISDRELEKYMKENNAAKWFSGFSLSERTPEFTVFTKLRKRIGTERLAKMFEKLKRQIEEAGYMNEVFTFVDASHLIAKASLWEERDEAIKKRYEKLNNENIGEISKDKEAKIGCKGKDKFFYGYKRHVATDMQSGLIKKIAITPANVTDSKGFKHVAPKEGAVYGDKGYCTNPAKQEAKRKNLHLAAIKKNNMKDKNKELDKYYSAVRAPYERVFSNMRKRARYKGICKNQFAAFMEALVYNFKRLTKLIPSFESISQYRCI